MNKLSERLGQAGRSGPSVAPDVEAIMERGHRIRRNRRITTTVATLALIGAGAVGTATYVRPASPTEVIAAGIVPVAEQNDEAPTTTEVETATTTTPAPADGDAAEEMMPAEEADADGSTLPPTTVLAEAESTTVPRPSAASVGDGSDGWLTATEYGVEHLRADGATGLITFDAPPGGFTQRWPTDVARIGDGHYLLIDQFVNRQDLADESVRALAERYGLASDFDGDIHAELDGIATPEELAALEHWEVSILAVDLATDEVITVETRIITSSVSPDWVYNGHITSDGSTILVMRELWQGHCLYAEGLTLGGQVVDIGDSKIYPKPAGVDSMTYDEIDAVFAGQEAVPEPCRTLADLPESGLEVWGTQADAADIAAFRTAFYEQGLG